MANLIMALDRVEFDSAGHKVMELDITPKVGYHDNADMMPLPIRDRPQAGALYSNVSFATYARGAGAPAGVVPPVDKLLLASGMEGVTVGATSVTYSLTPALTFSAVDIDYYPGNTYLISGNSTVLNPTWTFTPNEPVKESWTGSGTYTAPTDASGTAATVTGALQPICKGLTFTVGGKTLNIKGATITLGNAFPDPDEDIAGTNGIQDPELSNREVIYTTTFRLTTVAAYDIFASATAGTKTTLNAIVGSDAGNIITYNMDGYFNVEPDFGNSNGFHDITVSCRMSDESGEDGFTIVYT